MRPLSDRLVAFQQCCAGVGPGHGQGDDDEQTVELFGLGEPGVFHVQATGFAVAEQTFDMPAFTVQLKRPGGLDVGGDDQELAIGQAPGSEAGGGGLLSAMMRKWPLRAASHFPP